MSEYDIEMLSSLARKLLHAKKSEDDARKIRIEMEEKIASYIETPEEGQKSVKLADGIKVTVERGYNYSTDLDQFELFCKANDIFPPVKTKTTKELDKRGYNWYEVNNPEFFQKFSAFVSRKPKKTSVVISVKE